MRERSRWRRTPAPCCAGRPDPFPREESEIMTTIVPVILSGGSGTRLWPASTRDTPKQFQPLVGENSMFRQTLDRVTDRTRFAPPMIVCGAAHVAHVEADLRS